MITLDNSKFYSKAELDELLTKVKGTIYARVSTVDQAENGYSLESQVDKCKEYAEKNFGYLDDEFLVVIEPGKSGDNPDRPGLCKMLSLLEQGIGKKVIMLHPDRMSRDLGLQNQIYRRILGAGCDLEFVEMKIDPNNPESMFLLNIQGAVAQYNKTKILANSKRGRMQKVKNGQIPGARRLYGYTFDKEKDIYVENTDEKKNYLMIVEWFLNGKDGQQMNCTRIAEQLSLMGISAPNGDRWYQSTVSRILKNESYLGTYFYGKTEIVQSQGNKSVVKKNREDWHKIIIPGYIDEIKFQMVQKRLGALMKTPQGRNSHNYLLKGKIRCGRCGGAVVAGERCKTKNGVLRYYTCSKKAKKNFEVGTGKPNDRCVGCNWRQDIVDELVWNSVMKKIENPSKIISELLEQKSDELYIKEMEEKRKLLFKELKDKTELYDKTLDLYLTDFIKSKEKLQGKLDVIESQSNNIKSEIAILEATIQSLQVSSKKVSGMVDVIVKEFQKNIFQDEITIESKKKALDILVHEVMLYENTIQIVYNWKGSFAMQGSIHSNAIDSQGDGRP